MLPHSTCDSILNDKYHSSMPARTVEHNVPCCVSARVLKGACYMVSTLPQQHTSTPVRQITRARTHDDSCVRRSRFAAHYYALDLDDTIEFMRHIHMRIQAYVCFTPIRIIRRVQRYYARSRLWGMFEKCLSVKSNARDRV